MLRPFQGLCFALLAIVAMSACGSFSPYNFPIVVGTDDIAAASDEVPAGGTLRGGKERVVLVPTQSNKDTDGHSVHGAISPAIIDAINGTGTLTAVVGGTELQNIIDRHKEQGSALFADGGGAEIGKLHRARFVCMAVITGSSSNVTPTRGTREEPGSGAYWNGNCTVSMSFYLIDAQTGEYKIQKAVSSTATKEWEKNPGMGADQLLLNEAASTAMDQVTPHFAHAFPTRGYIMQLRGEREIAQITIPGTKTLPRETKVRVFIQKKHLDPRTKKIVFQVFPIGEMVVVHNDSNGIWCRVLEGEEDIRLGHIVQPYGIEDSED